MEKVKGTITAVSNKDGKYGIAMGQGNWYNGFGSAPCKKGDTVEITYEVNGNFKNIESVYVDKQVENKVSNLDENAMKRRKTDCVLAADEDFRLGKINKDQIAEHAKALYNLVEEL